MTDNHTAASFDWSAGLKAALEATPFMALATDGPQGIWNNAVHFAYDQHVNIYFISQLHSRHMQNIAAHAEVALAIFDSSQDAVGHVVGLQIRGQAELLPDQAVAPAHHLYYARSPEIPGISPRLSDYLGPQAPWKFVKVTAEEICLFDTRHFGGHRQTAPQGVTL
jgi:uncharacterized protein YhbP (UPF0306 family)